MLLLLYSMIVVNLHEMNKERENKLILTTWLVVCVSSFFFLECTPWRYVHVRYGLGCVYLHH